MAQSIPTKSSIPHTGADVECWNVGSSTVPITECVFMLKAKYFFNIPLQ